MEIHVLVWDNRVLGLNRLMGFQAYTLFIFGSPLAMIDDIVDQHYLKFLFLLKKTRKKTTKNNQKQQQTNKQTNKNMHRLASINTRYKKNLSSRRFYRRACIPQSLVFCVVFVDCSLSFCSLPFAIVL